MLYRNIIINGNANVSEHEIMKESRESAFSASALVGRDW
jgi:hypothetical protein